MVTRSKQDKDALAMLQADTIRVNVAGVQSTKRRLARDPARAKAYCNGIRELESAGYVAKITTEEAHRSLESWFIPHHMVHHNGKDRIVFNCSFQHHGQALNSQLLSGPMLGPSLLGVLLRFRQHTVAVSGDIKGMFHQVRLLPKDKPVLRFIWRDMQKDKEPEIYEWQVLPFGTTCSPCCAIYALQRHAQEYQDDYGNLAKLVENSFYVDNCLHSSSSSDEAKEVVNVLRKLLSEGGFDLRQWACNVPSVIEHLPAEAQSPNSELWLTKASTDLQELTLGLRWNCLTDTLGYNLRSAEPLEPTMRNMYKTLASQYDPLGYIIPFTTRAKILIQDLWKQNLGWDEPITPQPLKEKWLTWLREIPNLAQLQFPRPYTSGCADHPSAFRDLHIFCDASERAYGSVAYLHTTDNQCHVQLAKVLQTELSIKICTVTLWSDSTTVLTWLASESCRYKVFVGTRVAEIQTLTDTAEWRYVDSAHNPADHITRGLTLTQLASPHQWSTGPDFLLQPSDQWPSTPVIEVEPHSSELRKNTFIGTVTVSNHLPLDLDHFDTWQELVQATVRSLHGEAAGDSDPSPQADDYVKAEKLILAQAQQDSFPQEVQALKTGHPVPAN
ncbi:uncharacterized protein LOC110437994, partial [Tachysurus ichikawai]